MKLNKITKNQYENLSCVELFSAGKDYNRCYASITVYGINYKFAWGSDLIEPVVKELDLDAVAIGVDCNLCIIQLSSKTILHRVLPSNLFDICSNDLFVVCICETGVVSINNTDKDSVREYALDDIVEEYQLDGYRLICKLLNGSLATIDLRDNNDTHIIRYV